MDKLGGFHAYLNAQAEEYMISNTDIRYFFDTYYDNFMHSLSWEDHLLEPASREEWLATLRACADDQQQRCADNQILLEQYLYPLSSNPALLSDEGYDLLLSFCRDFYYNNYTEPALLIRIIDILLPHYEDRSDTESLLFLYICAGFSYMELSRTGEPTSRDKTVYFYTKVLSYRDQIEFFESAASRDYIFIAYYNLIRVAPGLGILDIETAYRLWEELCQIRTMPKFCQYDTTNPRIPQLCDRAINDFRAYGAVLNVERVIAPSAILSSLENMTQVYYAEILHEHGSIYECPVFTVFNYHYVQARNGTITWEAAWQILDDYYVHKMQTIGQVSSPDLLAFYTNLPLNLIDVLGHTHFKEEFKQATYRRYRNLITSYLMNQPASLNSYTLNNGVQLVAFHPLILGTFQNRMEKMNFIVDLVVTRHLTTFTHSVMVSYLAEAIGKHILAARPDSVLLSGRKCLCLPRGSIGLYRSRSFVPRYWEKRHDPDHQHAAPQVKRIRIQHYSDTSAEGFRLSVLRSGLFDLPAGCARTSPLIRRHPRLSAQF